MRTKLTILILSAAFQLFVEGCSSRNSNSKHEAAVIASSLLVQRDRSDIEKNVYSVARDEVIAGTSTFLFLKRFPYRDSPTTVVYCYERISERENQWVLRGYYPINLCDVDGTNLTSMRTISYKTDNSSVSILCNGSIYYTISSLANIIREREKAKK